MVGKVKRVYIEKGFGFIRNADGREYFFHKSELMNAKLEELQEGTEVEFDDEESKKGPRALQVFVQ
jgi:CspA family cold shock protein